MGAVLRELIIDCNEPRRVAEFWSAVLDWEIQETESSFWMSETGAPFPDFPPGVRSSAREEGRKEPTTPRRQSGRV